MADYRQQINIWFEGFDQRMNEAIPNVIAETATEFFKERFNTEEWDGKPWQALQPKYAAKKGRGRGRIMTASGALQRSIKPSEVKPNRVVISAGNTTVPYARIHNEGLSVKGSAKVRAYTNRNFMGKGQPMKISAHTRNINYTMPQRQFMGNSQFLNNALVDRLTTEFNK